MLRARSNKDWKEIIFIFDLVYKKAKKIMKGPNG
jgi:hypothetical protein